MTRPSQSRPRSSWRRARFAFKLLPIVGSFACLACTDTANTPTDDVALAGSSSVAGGSLSGSGGAAGSAGTPASQGGASGGSGSAGAGGSGGSSSMAGSGGGADAVSGAGGVSGAGSASGGTGGTGGSGAQEPPKVVLFDGTDLAAWKSRDGGGAAPWTTSDGAFAVAPGSGDIQTLQAFGDIQLHVEFWIPQTPTNNDEQDRGNSGIYLQGRYEVQVLDSYQHPLDGANDCAAIYELKNAAVNAALPAETWQTYEITFRAPRWTGQTKTENARISVIWNGQQAQSEVEVPAPTRLGDAEAPGPASLRLQDHAHGVRYRNVWLREL